MRILQIPIKYIYLTHLQKKALILSPIKINNLIYKNVSTNTDLDTKTKSESKTKEDNDTVHSLAKNIAQKDMPIEIVNPYERDRKVCILCKYGIKLDYKNPKLLSQFVSPFTGQIYEQHITRLCSKQQAILKNEIKKSITAGYMPAMIKCVEFLKDPPICDPSNPIKPHKW